jgi:tRNA (cmo5U34)-methyltransferase
MNKVKNHFEDEAELFDRVILTIIPHYPAMVQTLVDAIPFGSSESFRVVDLGCGTGNVAAQVLNAFPNAQMTCLDLAENMIAIARRKLAQLPHVTYVTADINDFEFRSKYDAIISSLSLHHLATDDAKRDVYHRIYKALNSGGIFYNADVVLASNDFLQDLYMKKWRQFMAKSHSPEEIEGTWIPKYKEEDHPAKLLDHLAWMTEVGFADVDVLWKYFNFAVYGGIHR